MVTKKKNAKKTAANQHKIKWKKAGRDWLGDSAYGDSFVVYKTRVVSRPGTIERLWIILWRSGAVGAQPLKRFAFLKDAKIYCGSLRKRALKRKMK